MYIALRMDGVKQLSLTFTLHRHHILDIDEQILFISNGYNPP